VSVWMEKLFILKSEFLDLLTNKKITIQSRRLSQTQRCLSGLSASW
jgi:hypothetical protein